MRARHQTCGISVLPGERHEQIGRVVAMRLKPKAFRMISDEPVRKLLAVAVRVAADPIPTPIAAAGAKGVKQGRSVALLSQDCGHHFRRTNRHQ
jgi:hypothetical protein